MKKPFFKLSIANFCISFFMLLMLVIAEIFKVKQMFGVITGVYWIVLDLAVLAVSLVTGISLWRITIKKSDWV
jgi:hypothetical protein